jgi:hypothetical protein
MKKIILSTVILLVSAAFTFAEKAPQKVYDMANSELAALGTDSTIVNAVKTENATGKSLDQIKERDASWKGTAGIDSFMQSILDNDCSKSLVGQLDSIPALAEIFVMDNQGANVCMTDKTSDYWQGDEAKFQKSYNGGAGAVFVDEVEFDDSTQAYLVQVSVPVKDGGKTIGAITFGLDIDKIE